MADTPSQNDFLSREVDESQTSPEIKQRTQKALSESKKILNNAESLGAKKEALRKEYEEVRLATIASLRELRHETGASLEAFKNELSGENSDSLSDGTIDEKEIIAIEKEAQDLKDIASEASSESETVSSEGVSLENLDIANIASFDSLSPEQKEQFHNSEDGSIYRKMIQESFAIEYLKYVKKHDSGELLNNYKTFSDELKSKKSILSLILSSNIENNIDGEGERLIDILPAGFIDNTETVEFVITTIRKNPDNIGRSMSLVSDIFKRQKDKKILGEIIESKAIPTEEAVSALPASLIKDNAFIEKHFSSPSDKIALTRYMQRIGKQIELAKNIFRKFEENPDMNLSYNELNLINLYIEHEGPEKYIHVIRSIINEGYFIDLHSIYNHKDLVIYAMQSENLGVGMFVYISNELKNDKDIIRSVYQQGKDSFIKFIHISQGHISNSDTIKYVDELRHELNIGDEEIDEDNVFHNSSKIQQIQQVAERNRLSGTSSINEPSSQEPGSQESENTKNSGVETNTSGSGNEIISNGDTFTVKTSSGDSFIITAEEKSLADDNPEVLDNMVNFYQFFKELNMEGVWEYRKELTVAMDDMNINLYDNSLNKRELIKYGNFIAKLINGLQADVTLNTDSTSTKILTSELKKFSESGNFMAEEKTFNSLGEDKITTLLRENGIIGNVLFDVNKVRDIMSS